MASGVQDVIDSIDDDVIGLSRLRLFLAQHGNELPGVYKSEGRVYVPCTDSDYDAALALAYSRGVPAVPTELDTQGFDFDFGGSAVLRVYRYAGDRAVTVTGTAGCYHCFGPITDGDARELWPGTFAHVDCDDHEERAAAAADAAVEARDVADWDAA